MLLKTLHIQNLASIEDATIDFSANPLNDTPIFLISGTTGSGKSTILDAISLVLYGDTPRLANSDVNSKIPDVGGSDKLTTATDNSNLMRRGTGFTNVELTFTGTNGAEYLAQWTRRRARNKPDGKIQNASWQLTRFANESEPEITLTKQAEVKEELKQAVGLDFNEFSRTTLLAQGEFTRFLNSKDEDKSAILEKIIGVGEYTRIGANIYAITSERKAEWEEARRSVQDIKVMTDEELFEVQTKKEEGNKRLKDLTTNLEKKTAVSTWKARLQQASKSLTDAENNLNKVRELSESDEAKKRATTITKYHKSITARISMDESDKALKELESNQNLLEAKHRELTDIRCHLAYSAHSLKDEQKSLDEQYPMSVSELSATEHYAALSKNQEKYQRLTQRISGLDKLKTVLEGLSEKSQLAKDSDKAIKELGESIEILSKTLEAQTSDYDKAKSEKAGAEEIFKTASLSLDDWADRARAQLKPGDRCPVCQREINEALPTHEHINAIIGPMREQLAQMDERINKLLKAKVETESELKTKQKLLEAEAKTYARLSKEIEEKTQAVAKLRMELAFTGDREALSGEIASLKNQQAEIDAKIKAGQKISRQIDEIRRKRDALKKKLEKLQRSKGLVEQILQSQTQWSSDFIEAANRKISDCEVALQKLAPEIAAIKSSIDSAKGRYDTAKSNVAKFIEQNTEFTLEELQRLSNISPEEIRRMETTAEELKAKLSTAIAGVEQRKKDLEDISANPPQEDAKEMDSDALNTEIETLKSEISSINREIGAIDESLKSDAEKRESVAEKLEEVERLKAIYERWDKLNNLLGDATGKKFRTIALSYVLGNLIHAANRYMRIFLDRYRLTVIHGSFAIMVEDLYQGHQRRPAANISGGESFLVSLSLALALAEIGKALAVDILFIDEGFGTLSAELLNNTINGLQSLHKTGGRRVGIISHVEELKESIPVQILVDRPATSSAAKVTVVPQ